MDDRHAMSCRNALVSSVHGLLRDEEVAGSNPVTPTTQEAWSDAGFGALSQAFVDAGTGPGAKVGAYGRGRRCIAADCAGRSGCGYRSSGPWCQRVRAGRRAAGPKTRFMTVAPSSITGRSCLR